MQSAQGELAKAYGSYYDALKAGDKNPDQSAILGPAQQKLNSMINDRQQVFEKSIYGKVFHPDGTVTDMATGKTVEKGKLADASKKSREKDGKSSGWAASKSGDGKDKIASNGSGGNGTDASGGKGAKRKEYVLDGKDIPKELDFGSAARSPASGSLDSH